LEYGDHIVEFVSGGPKNYAYTTANAKQTCKIRGFSLNHANAQILNFDTIQEMVGYVDPSKPHTHKKRKLDDSDLPPSKRIVLTNPTKICRDKYANLVFNRKEEKQYRVIYDKRTILKNLDTLPYGH
jgi:hypothetical protein